MNFISVSQINSYLNCPYQYFLKYIDKDKPSNFIRIDNLLLGNAFHKYIQKYLKNIPIENIEDIFYTELLFLIENNKIDGINEFALNEYKEKKEKDIFEKILKKEDFDFFIKGYSEMLKTKTVERPSLLTIYKNLVTFFQEKKSEILQDIEIIDIECIKTVSFKKNKKRNIYIKAVFDVFGFSKKLNKYIIIDWKTGSKKWSGENSLKRQDVIYSYLSKKIYDEIPLFFYYIFVYSTSTGEIKLQKIKIQHNEDALQIVENDIKDIEASIKKGIFYKNDSSWICSRDYCEFFDGCQSYKNEIKIEIYEQEFLK